MKQRTICYCLKNDPSCKDQELDHASLSAVEKYSLQVCAARLGQSKFSKKVFSSKLPSACPPAHHLIQWDSHKRKYNLTLSKCNGSAVLWSVHVDAARLVLMQGCPVAPTQHKGNGPDCILCPASTIKRLTSRSGCVSLRSLRLQWGAADQKKVNMVC